MNIISVLLIFKILYDMVKYYIGKNMIYYGINLIVDLQLMVIILMIGR